MPILSRFLQALHSRPRWGWVALLAYASAVTFPHENVQWVVNQLAFRITLHRLYQLSAALAGLQAILFTSLVVYRLRKQATRAIPAAFWILTLALIAFTWHAFTANNTELVHYPQYVPEGMALLALTLSPAESLAWIAILGGLDEGYQYAVLSWWRPVPFDFNDVYMDLLGGALGILMAMVLLRCSRRDSPFRLWKKPGIVALLATVGTGIVLWVLGFMLLFEDKADTRHWFALSRFRAPEFWLQVEANGPNRYHTLSPIEGPLLILATIAVYALLDRWVKVRAAQV